MCFKAINGFRWFCVYIYIATCLHSVSYTTLFLRHPHAKNPTIQTQDSWVSHFLLLWTPHLEFSHDLRHSSTLSSFKAKLKTFLYLQYSAPNNINTQFTLQCVCVCVCVCVYVRACMHIMPYVNRFGRTVL